MENKKVNPVWYSFLQSLVVFLLICSLAFILTNNPLPRGDQYMLTTAIFEMVGPALFFGAFPIFIMLFSWLRRREKNKLK